MWKKSVFREGEAGEAYDEERFLADFMNASDDWVFVPVLGWAGAGKSHLVRWLHTRTEATGKRQVLLLPKTDTNLKDIIEKILDLVDDPSLAEYRQRLREATADLTAEQARERLLDFLAAYVGPNYHPVEEQLTREQRYLSNKLPAFLRDDLVRGHLLRSGGFFDRLVTHVLGRSTAVERLDARREMKADDLPRNLLEISQTSFQVQDFYRFMLGPGNPKMWDEAVNWINSNLDPAISELLRFRGDDLRQLMRGVREILGKRHVELILLIEDFAKLQGIDLQLLEALLERPDQPGRPRMCALRTAIAMNTGYFLRLPETLRQRVSFHVDMDVPQENSTSDFREVGPHFAARYLNAVRFRPEELDHWHAERDTGASPVPSACVACPHNGPCHQGFGASEGYGLYPFNATALNEMLQRVTDPDRRNHFVPRLLIKDVLKKVLADYTLDIQHGTYPSRSLLAAFGGSSLDPSIQVDLAKKDPRDPERRAVLLQLYAEDVNRHGITDLDPAVHEAFGIPALGLSGLTIDEGQPKIAVVLPVVPATSPTTPLVPPPPVPRTRSTATDPIAESYQQLTDWSNKQKELPQNLLTKLRLLIHGTVEEVLKWDTEMLVRDMLSSKSSPFRPPSINFQDQSVQRGNAPIQIELPLQGHGRAETALVMRSLLRFDQQRSWDYEGGFDDLRRLGMHSQCWADAVRDQILQPGTSATAKYDVVSLVVGVMALGSRLHRLTTVEDTSLADEIDVLFSQPLAVVGRSQAWTDLATAYSASYSDLKNILLSRIACVKGGSARNLTIIDAAQLVPVLKALRHAPGFVSPFPEAVWIDYAKLKEARRMLETGLSGALAQEQAHWLKWEKDIAGEFPSAKVSETIRMLRVFVDFAVDHGRAAQGIREELEREFTKVDPVRLTELIAVIERLKTAVNEIDRWRILALDYPPAMQVSRSFVEVARRFVETVDRRAEMDLQNFRRAEGNMLGDEIDMMTKACKGIVNASTTLGLKG
jgi:hypothetical protein